MIFFKKFKGFKINDYPLNNNFFVMNFKDKINHLKKMENYISYTLNNKNIELINLINDFRTKNNLNKLNYSMLERLSEFFNQQNSQNEKYLFKYQKDKFKFDVLNNTQKII